MNIAVVVLLVLPTLIHCSGEGNIHLLEEDVAAALKSCRIPDDIPRENKGSQRHRRSGESSRSTEGKNTTDAKDQISVLNSTNYNGGNETGGGAGSGDKMIPFVPQPASKGYNNTEVSVNRTKRNDPMLNKQNTDECLSQCVFANLQVVDSMGIPREAELWSKIQTSVTSQQSRTALRDQTRACFQELQSEAEDNGCSYSNKLERCLMLRFLDRKDGVQANSTQKA